MKKKLKRLSISDLAHVRCFCEDKDRHYSYEAVDAIGKNRDKEVELWKECKKWEKRKLACLDEIQRRIENEIDFGE